MNFSLTLGRFTLGKKAATRLPMATAGAGASRLGQFLRNLLLPSSTVDYRALAGDRWRNSIVAASLQWINRNMVQAPLRVYVRDSQGKALPLVNHALEQLLRRPNPQYDGDTLRKATMLSLVTGAANAYWWIKRDKGSGLPIEFWYIPHFQIWPYWTEDATTETWLAGYIYRCNGVDTPLAVEDVIHFRDGIDPYNQRLGLDLLDSASRELVADNEASGYLVAMLKNMGITPVIISPKDPNVDFDKATRDIIKEQFEEQVTGDNRFRPVVGSGGVDVQQIQLSPRDMLLETAQDNPEARLCALIGVPAVVLGLKVGLDHSTYSNMEEARRAGWEDGIIPRNMLITAHLTQQVLPDFEANPNAFVDADYSRVKALQDNQAELLKQITQATGRPVLTVNEARERLGYDSITGGEQLYLPPAPSAPVDPKEKPEETP